MYIHTVAIHIYTNILSFLRLENCLEKVYSYKWYVTRNKYSFKSKKVLVKINLKINKWDKKIKISNMENKKKIVRLS